MPSFDVVSKVDLQEVDNAVNGVKREVGSRYDFKGSKTDITRKDGEITILADDDYKMKTVQEMLKVHVTKRQMDPRALDFQKVEMAGGNMQRVLVKVKQGIDQDTAKNIVKEIKDQKSKVQASIRGDELRITGKQRDDLQQTMQFIKGLGTVNLPLQFVNFRD